MNDKGVLGQLNPALKLSVHFVFMLLLSVIKDPQTSFMLMLIPLFAVFTFVDVPRSKLLLYCLPLFPLFFLSVWSLAAFGRGETVWFSWAWFNFTKEGFLNGLTIGFRMLGFVFYGLLFTLTTDFTSFVISLMQQFRLRPKWAYALLAGVRFVPLFWSEYEQIRAAHRVRGVHRAKGVRERVQAAFRYTVPLLAQGIRKAERVAIALEARGFDGSWNRTFYRAVGWGKRDIYYFLVLAVLHGLLIAFSSALGYVRWGMMF
ncbi:energy-coupling factor transporter transmembrane component T family protein [Numidum massiliense]|uniref:energy-coupling factor transporter transmembrane component T family protein n=1 Tax=Numidum massiliense TaxID=1522315 RepID=UPI0006D58B70|nr:energy-coupling factor transporter transmembrane component T [Numidum massiliense]